MESVVEQQEEERKEKRSELAQWLLLVPLILLLLFGCGTCGMMPGQSAHADTRSQMNADYSPWPFIVLQPINPDIIEEIRRDAEYYPGPGSESFEPIVEPGDFWATATPTPEGTQGTPTATLLASSTPSVTMTPAGSATATLTATDTATATVTDTGTPEATSTPSMTASPSRTPTETSIPWPPPPVPPPGPPPNTYWFYDDTTPFSYMMYTSIPSGSFRSGSTATYYSPQFTGGQRLLAGTTIARFYAYNPSSASVSLSVELRAGSTVLGSASFALPPNVTSAYFFSASIANIEHDFVSGQRLILRLSVGSPARLFWDGAYNYSGVQIPSIVSVPTPTSTRTSTATMTATITDTPTITHTPTITNTPAPTSTSTPAPPTATNTTGPTSTSTDTATPTDTLIASDTPTPTSTETSTPTDTPVATDTPTATSTETSTPTDTPIATDTPTATSTETPTPTSTETPTPTSTETPTPTSTETPTPTSTETPTPTSTETPTPTSTETPTPTSTETPTPTSTETPTPTSTETPTPTSTETPTPTSTETPTPTSTETPTPTPTNTPSGCSGEILMVVGDLVLNSGDAAVRSRLEGYGYTVIVVLDTASSAADATGRDLVIISSTAESVDVSSKFRDVTVPVIVYEPWIFDDMGMTGPTEWVDYTWIADQTQLDIIDPGHPLAAGLSGTLTVSNVADVMTMGVPNANAARVATQAGDPGWYTIFAYETGASMVGVTAPARRVGYYLNNAMPDTLTEDGRALFDAAVNWALNTCALPAPTWWDCDWDYRIQLTFDNQTRSEDLNEFPVLVTLNGGRIDYGSIQGLGEDIRFVDSDNVTVLAHEIEYWNVGGDSYVWVNVPRIDGNSDTDYIWMYYGNGSVGDGQDAENTWVNYRGVWHLDENQIGIANPGVYEDSTSNNFHGDDEISAIGQDGQIAGGQEFDGVNDYIDLGTTNILDGTDTFTFSAWVNIDTLPGLNEHYGVYSRFPGADNGSFRFMVGQWALANDSTLDISTNDGAWHDAVANSQSSTGTWTYLTAVYDGVGTVNFYFDGAPDGSDSFTEPSVVAGASQYIGAGSTGVFRFDGFIDELRLSTAIRSADWIEAQHESMTDSLISSYGIAELATSYCP